MIDQTVQEAEWTLCHLRREIPKKIQMQLNALSTEDLGMTLTDEMLTQIEKEKDEEEYRLSMDAMSGTTSEECMGVRALIRNQVMLILVD